MTLSEKTLLELFSDLTVWRRGDQRAPHKPLLLLYTLARVQRGGERLEPFEKTEAALTRLLVDFGPQRKSYHPEEPFWRLQNDGEFWQVPQRGALLEAIAKKKDQGSVPKSVLRKLGAEAGFSRAVDAFLREHPEVVNRLAAFLLEQHFTPSYVDDILDAVGMPWVVEPKRRKRDPRFRDTVLRIYAHRCAICGYDGKLGYAGLGLEAAHVKWHAAGGPDSPDNGLALCSFHHKALDRGALGLDQERRILVSEHVHGQTGVDEWLLRYAGQALRAPQPGQPQPAAAFMLWHRREVFRSPARSVVG